MKDVRARSSQAIQSEIFLHARQTKVLLWADVERGGCHQTGGQLALSADGSGIWTCVTTSCNASPGDIWQANFCINDMNGEALFGAGPFYSPRMCFEEGTGECRWSGKFSFQAELFDAIHAALQHCGTLPPVCVLKVSEPNPPGRTTTRWQSGQMARLLDSYA